MMTGAMAVVVSSCALPAVFSALLPQAAAASAISNAILMHRILFDLVIDITPVLY
jgi:hypothetical protein